MSRSVGADLRSADRKEEADGRAFIDFTGQRNCAAMAADGSEHGGQSEAAAPDLGREEWIENPQYGLLAYALAGVGYFHENIISGFSAVGEYRGIKIFPVAVYRAGDYFDCAAFPEDRFG